MGWRETCIGFLQNLSALHHVVSGPACLVVETYFDTDLLIHALLFFLYLLLQLLDGSAIWCGAIRLEDLDILICEWRNLLLLNLFVGKILLILLPVPTCCGRLQLVSTVGERTIYELSLYEYSPC
jgi:hypothetical protein